MILIHSDGRTLDVYRMPDPIMRLVADRGCPLKMNGWHVMDEEAARAALREIVATGLYSKVALHDDRD